jgi:hypothetical protein
VVDAGAGSSRGTVLGLPLAPFGSILFDHIDTTQQSKAALIIEQIFKDVDGCCGPWKVLLQFDLCLWQGICSEQREISL